MLCVRRMLRRSVMRQLLPRQVFFVCFYTVKYRNLLQYIHSTRQYEVSTTEIVNSVLAGKYTLNIYESNDIKRWLFYL